MSIALGDGGAERTKILEEEIVRRRVRKFLREKGFESEGNIMMLLLSLKLGP